jgi:hypothetical protein
MDAEVPGPRDRRKRWPFVAAGIVLLAGLGIGIGLAASGKKAPVTPAASLAPATTTPPQDTTPTTSGAPTDLPLGTAATITNNGSPDFDVTATQIVDPAQPADQYVTPQNAGDIFVAVAFTLTDTGTANVSDDIYSDTKIFDSAGQGYEGDFEDTASGPSFPSGEIDIAPGGTASGWVMFEVPGSATLATVTFTPSSGFATQATTSWNIGS